MVSDKTHYSVQGKMKKGERGVIVLIYRDKKKSWKKKEGGMHADMIKIKIRIRRGGPESVLLVRRIRTHPNGNLVYNALVNKPLLGAM